MILQKITDKLNRKQTFSNRATHMAKFWIERLDSNKPLPDELADMPEHTTVDIWRKLRCIYCHEYMRTIPAQRGDFNRKSAFTQVRELLEWAGPFV